VAWGRLFDIGRDGVGIDSPRHNESHKDEEHSPHSFQAI